VSKTPDRHPGVLVETEEILLGGDTIGDPTDLGGMRYVGGAFRLKDAQGVFDPREMTPAQHAALRQLIHLADGDGPFEEFPSGAYQETLPAGDPFPTSFIWWESSAKLKKIVEETVTYNANKTIATDQWKVYDTDGVTVLATATDTMTYTAVFETSRTRVIT
jgi:hypothetical protein